MLFSMFRFPVAAAALTLLIISTGCSHDLDDLTKPGGKDKGGAEASVKDASPDQPKADGPVPDKAAVDGPLKDGPAADLPLKDKGLIAETISPDRTLLDMKVIAPDKALPDATQPDLNKKCGNKSIDTGEECDGKAAPGKDCKKLGFEGGWLGCTSKCKHDTSDCYAVLDKTPHKLGEKTRDPVVACGKKICLAVWEDYANKLIKGRLVDPSSTKPPATAFTIAQKTHSKTEPSVVFDGLYFLVVWNDFRNSVSSPDVFGARVETTGKVKDLNTNLSLVLGVGGITQTSLASVGQGSVLAYNSNKGIFGVTVGQTGKITSTSPAALDTGSTHSTAYASVAGLATGWAVAWQDGWSTKQNYGRVRLFDKVLTPRGTKPVTLTSGLGTMAQVQMTPYGSALYLAAYRTHAGTAINAWTFDASSLQHKNCVSSGCVGGKCGYPRMGGGGGKALVVRSVNGDRLEAVGITAACNGVTSAMTVRAVNTAAPLKNNSYNVAYSASNYVVVWKDKSAGKGWDDAYAARVAW